MLFIRISRIDRFRRSLLSLCLRMKIIQAAWVILFVYEVPACNARKSVIEWDRLSREELRYPSADHYFGDLGLAPAVFISRSLPCRWVYIFDASPIFANIANASAVAGFRRHPSRRFISSPSAAPTTPLGSVCLASPACYRFHLDLDEPQRLIHALPSSRPDAGSNTDDDVQYWIRPQWRGFPTCSARRDTYDLTAIFHDDSTFSVSTRAVEPLSACNLDIANERNPAAR